MPLLNTHREEGGTEYIEGVTTVPSTTPVTQPVNIPGEIEGGEVFGIVVYNPSNQSLTVNVQNFVKTGTPNRICNVSSFTVAAGATSDLQAIRGLLRGQAQLTFTLGGSPSGQPIVEWYVYRI